MERKNLDRVTNLTSQVSDNQKVEPLFNGFCELNMFISHLETLEDNLKSKFIIN